MTSSQPKLSFKMRRLLPVFAVIGLLGVGHKAHAVELPDAELAAQPLSEKEQAGAVQGLILDGINEFDSLEELMHDATELAQNTSGNRARTRTRSSSARPAARSANGRAGGKMDSTLAKARQLATSGQYQDASKLLFQMSRSPKYEKESSQIKYILGLMLYEMKLNQAAAFVFYDVIRNESKSGSPSRYLRLSLEKLALAADSLNSDVLLKYAIKQIKEDEFPAASRDMLYYRMGELKMQEKDFPAATREFVKVRQGSLFYHRARYKLALALTEAGQLDKALLAFEDLAEQSKELGVTNPIRVSALLGRARVLYQRQNFEGALEAYRDIPRDTEQWHEALFESSWAMLRDGRFRSALSNFHSLHSAYYEDFYQPESLLLRAIVYLYICKYDEMDKVISLYERVYRPVQRDVKNMLTTVNEPLAYYREIAKVADRFESIRSTERVSRKGLQLPFLVARQVLREGDVRRTFNYLHNLDVEKKRVEGMPAGWRTAGVGQYVKKIVEKRIQATQGFAGKQIRHHLILIQEELRDLFEQTGFLRFEMLSSKKETVKKEIAGKSLAKGRVDDSQNRNYYIQNGYEYWPFTGEYWLDEIGNYHYVGVKACE